MPADEEWNQQQTDVSIYLINGQSNVTLPRPSRHSESEKQESKNERFQRLQDYKSIQKYDEEKQYSKSGRLSKEDEKILHSKFLFTERDQEQHYQKQHKHLEQQKSTERSEKYYDPSDRYDFEERRRHIKDELKFYDNSNYKAAIEKKYNKYHDQEDDGFEENIKYRLKGSKYEDDPRYYDRNNRYYNEDNRHSCKDEDYDDRKAPVPKTRQKYSADDPRFYSDEKKSDRYSKQEIKPRQKYSADDPRFYDQPDDKDKYRSYEKQTDRSLRSKCSQQDYFDEPIKRRNDHRSPTPEDVSPRDRFKDAKEKFLLLERDRIEQERKYRQEALVSPKDKHKRNGERYFDFDERYYEDFEDHKPRPAPRNNINDEVRYRREPLDRYRSEKYDPKRRSMFNLIEEEHKKNSNEIAKELKRRSYLESRTDDEYYRDRSYTDLPESDRYPGMDRDPYGYSKSSVDLDKNSESKYDPKFVKNQKMKNSAGYRHSYAEPKLKMDKNAKKHFSEMLHRTNSTVSNSGRVGIASVQPY